MEKQETSGIAAGVAALGAVAAIGLSSAPEKLDEIARGAMKDDSAATLHMESYEHDMAGFSVELTNELGRIPNGDELYSAHTYSRNGDGERLRLIVSEMKKGEMSIDQICEFGRNTADDSQKI
jgi:hypothetical protein